MADYPLSSGQILEIAIREVAKEIPVVGIFVSAHKEVFNQIEYNRLRALVAELALKVDNLSAKLLEPRNAEITLFTCDIARSDSLIGSKAKAYAGVVAQFFGKPEVSMEVVVEIVDNLRKLNVGDLKILYRFTNSSAESLPMESIADLQPNYDLGTVVREGQRKMTEVIPHILRLESFGLLYRAPDNSRSGLVLEIGALSSELNKRVFLTDMGKRLTEALPP